MKPCRAPGGLRCWSSHSKTLDLTRLPPAHELAAPGEIPLVSRRNDRKVHAQATSRIPGLNLLEI